MIFSLSHRLWVLALILKCCKIFGWKLIQWSRSNNQKWGILFSAFQWSESWVSQNANSVKTIQINAFVLHQDQYQGRRSALISTYLLIDRQGPGLLQVLVNFYYKFSLVQFQPHILSCLGVSRPSRTCRGPAQNWPFLGLNKTQLSASKGSAHLLWGLVISGFHKSWKLLS